MKCEICHKADAEQAILRKREGGEQELYVCSACAIHGQLPKPPEKTDSHQKKLPGKTAVPKKPSEVLPELVGMIIDATLEIMNQSLPSEESVCPYCGITRSEYRKTSRLGCAICYEAFAKELGGLVADMHRHTQHVGKRPRRGRADDVAF